jgi:aryl-alcohol dehydrogenase-like predicted oxidoreductase
VLGRTGLAVSVLGFGGAEVGFAQLACAAVGRLLTEVLDAGLDVTPESVSDETPTVTSR